MVASVRAFIAIHLPHDVLQAITSVQSALKSRGLKFRWVKAQNVHLTLKFLGDISPADIGGIGRTMAATAGRYKPISLAARGLGVFPGIKRARVVWVGVGGNTEPLGQLQRHLEQGLAEIGFPSENRPFRSHLTVARSKGKIDPRRLGDALREVGQFDAVPFVADRIHLIQSDLRPDGPIYTPLWNVSLGQ